MVVGFGSWRLAAAFVFLFATSVFADVSVRTGVNRDTITVGDPIVYRMRIRHSETEIIEVVPGAGFPGPFTIQEERPPSVRTLDDHQAEETRDYVLTVFDVGEFILPPITVRYLTSEGDSGRVFSNPVAVLVQSVLPENQEDIQDIKGPRNVSVTVPTWIWAGAGLLILAVALFIWWIRKRRRRERDARPPLPIDWRAEVDKIDRMGLPARREFKLYYSLLSEVLRRFLEERTQIEAMEQTTFEISLGLRGTRVGEKNIQDIEGFLAEADLVKFAKFKPQTEVANEAVSLVRKLVVEIEGKFKSPSTGDQSTSEAVEAAS